MLSEFKRTYYGNRSFASELAKRGYVVMAIDMFYWGERRMLLPDDPPVWRDREAMTAQDIAAFHRRSSEKTWLVGTGLFEAGITWAGVMFTDDIRTVDYLVTRRRWIRSGSGAAACRWVDFAPPIWRDSIHGSRRPSSSAGCRPTATCCNPI